MSPFAGVDWFGRGSHPARSVFRGWAGNAGKQEVERMVGLLLNIDTTKLLDDTTDALAVALATQAIKL